MLSPLVSLLLVAAGAAVIVAVPGEAGGQPVAAQATTNTGLGLGQVYNQTEVGGFSQAGNTLLQCAGTWTRYSGAFGLPRGVAAGSPLPAGGCVHDISQALAPGNVYPNFSAPTFNNQVNMAYLDADGPGNATTDSSSATVTVPSGAQVVYADLSWMGATQSQANPTYTWTQNPNIYTQPMQVSVGDASNYQAVSPDRGTYVAPGTAGASGNQNDYYYTASADVTSLFAGRTGGITVWGANAPFWSGTAGNGPPLDEAALSWDIVVVYAYDSIAQCVQDNNPAASCVAKQITVQDGFVYQSTTTPATTEVVNVPEVTSTSNIQVGLVAGEGDAGNPGDTFAVNGDNVVNPGTGQANNFFVSYAQGATDPDWTDNFSTDDVGWTLPPNVVAVGATALRLTTGTTGDGFILRGLTTAVPVPALALTKTVAPHYSSVGQTLPYTFAVTNESGVPVTGLTLDDPHLGGNVADCARAELAADASYTCTGNYTVTAADIAAGRIDNTATVTGLDPLGDPLTAAADATTTTATTLKVVKTPDPGQAFPVYAGDSFSYLLTVENLVGTDGQPPADAADVTLTDPLPAGLVNPAAGTPTLKSTGAPITGAAATITGSLLTATVPVLPGNDSFTVTLQGSIANPLPAADNPLVNTASVTAPNTNCDAAGDDPADCTDTTTNTVLEPATVTVTKTASQSALQPGEQFAYTVQVQNTSTTTAASATLADPIPAPLVPASTTWTCSPSSGSACGTAGGTGDIAGVALTLLPQGVATFEIEATVPATYQGGSFTNVATAAPGQHTVCQAPDPGATTCSAPVTTTVTPDPAPLLVTKTHASPTPTAGQDVTYTVTVQNLSASTVAHATFADPAPTGLDATGTTWSGAGTSGATTVSPPSGSGSFPSGVVLVIAPGDTVTFTITAPVVTAGNVVNVATVTPGPNTRCEDGDPTSCDATDEFTGPARLVITKTHDPTDPNPGPGDPITYQVVVSNPDATTGTATFSDPLPSQVTGATWTCTASTGSSCGTTSGTGSPDGVAIAVAGGGGTVTFAFTATLSTSPVALGPITNTATATPGTDTGCMDAQPVCAATDTFTPDPPPPATLSLTKTQAPTDPLPVQGQPVTYTVVAANTSGASQAEATVTDGLTSPALTGITWTAQATSGSTVGGGTTASGTGPFVTVPVVLAPGGAVTFTVQATVGADWPGGDIDNTAVGTPGTGTECDPADPSCSSTTVLPTPSPITIAKTQLPTAPAPKPGEQTTYQIVVTNVSPLQAAQATVADPLPPQLDRATATWTTATTGIGATGIGATGIGATGIGTTASPKSGTGPVGVTVTLAPEGTLTIVVTATVEPTFGGGAVTNVATATPGTDTSCQGGTPTCAATTTFVSTPDPATVSILKTPTFDATGLRPGQPVSYLVTVTSLGTTTTGEGTVGDPVPAGLVAMSWTATVTAGSSATPASGTGAVAAGVTIPPGGTVTFAVRATVDPRFNGGFDIDNVATFVPGTNTACQPTDLGTPCNTNTVVSVVLPASTPGAPAATPPPASSPPGGSLLSVATLPATGTDVTRQVLLAALLMAGGLILLVGSRPARMRRHVRTPPPRHRRRPM
jgi:uncharacterized repeat protein (TIGR01451 family)